MLLASDSDAVGRTTDLNLKFKGLKSAGAGSWLKWWEKR